jgi:hypothetical protein
VLAGALVGSAADRLRPVVSVANRGWRRRGGDGVVILLNRVVGSDELVRLGSEGCVEASEQLLARDERQVSARGRDGNGRGDLGRHGEDLW